MRTVLVLSHNSPPQGNSGAVRVAAFLRYLPEFGWRPVLVTSKFAGEGPVGAAHVRRIGEPLLLYHRRAAGRGDRSPDEVVVPPGRIKRLLIDAVAVPDLHLGWALAAAPVAVRIARAAGADALLTTSPPESCHVAGLIVRRATGLPWVAEFRDGWMFEGLKDLDRRPLRRRVEGRIEAMVARRGSLVGVTRPIAADLAARYGSAEWIPNGYDDEEIPEGAWREARALLPQSSFNLVYTGTLSAGRPTMSAATLAEAMRLVAARPGRRPVSLTVMGRLYPHESRLLSAIPGCRVAPFGPRPAALALQRLADALVLVTVPGEASIATGKLFEYLGAGRPILALAHDNEAAAIVEETRAGPTVSADDPVAVADAIRALADGMPLPEPDAAVIARFHRRAVTERLASLLDAVAG